MTAIPAIFMQVDDKTVENTTTETTLLTSGLGTLTIPAHSLLQGAMYRVTLKGDMGAGAIAPTLHVRLYLGGVKLLDVVTSALVAGSSNRRWSFQALFCGRTVDEPGFIYGNGELHYSGSAGGVIDIDGALVEMQTQVALAIDVTAQWNVASVNNTITCREAVIESLST